MHLINKNRDFTRRDARIKALSDNVTQSFTKLVKIFSLISCFLLAGCVTTQDEIEPDQFTHINQISGFEIQGKVAVLTPEERRSVNFFWHQDKDKYSIRFSTFLGIEVANISGDRQQIKIIADGKEYESTQPELLLKEVIGWQIPIRQLSNWLTGRVKGVVMVTHDSSNMPKKVLARVSSQEEWIINFPQYQQVHKLQLPKRINLKQHNTKINLSINKWVLN